MNIILDIETLPTADPTVRDQLAARIKPSAAMKKAETIAKWEAEEKPAAIDEAVAKTALDGTYGRLAVLGLMFDDEPLAIDATCGTEKWMLESLMRQIDKRVTASSRPLWIGHNIHGFDLPFLWKRCVIHQVRPSPWLPFGVKAWSERIADTMLMWDDSRERRISLDALCRVLGVTTPKGDLDGSKVAEAWNAGRHEDVIAYCMADVDATRKCWKRMRFETVSVGA